MLGKGNNLVPRDLSYPRENLGTRLKKELTLLQLTCAFRALHSSPHSLTPPLFFPPRPSSPHFQLQTGVVWDLTSECLSLYFKSVDAVNEPERHV